MRVIVAPNEYVAEPGDITCFLAGGITNCWEWQNAVIAELEKFEDTDRLVLFNPRRENFPIEDPNAAQEQIEWEYNMLHKCDIFSMYFTSGDSDQPICMYELGVHLTRAEFCDKPRSIIVSIEEGYRRKQDVIIQTKLASDFMVNNDFVLCPSSAEEHAKRIHDDYLGLVKSSVLVKLVSEE